MVEIIFKKIALSVKDTEQEILEKFRECYNQASRPIDGIFKIKNTFISYKNSFHWQTKERQKKLINAFSRFILTIQ